MTKVFISQPMRGKTEEEILREREALIRATEEEFGEVEILDSYFADYDGNALQFLAKSIAVLAQADAAVFAIDWESARGCRRALIICVKTVLSKKLFYISRRRKRSFHF